MKCCIDHRPLAVKPFTTSGVTQAFLVLCQGLTILGSDAKKSQQAFLAPLPGMVAGQLDSKSSSYPCLIRTFTYLLDQTTRFDYAAPSGAELEPPSSSQDILAVRYELHPSLIVMVHENPFSGEGDENPYTHLRDFEQLCSCIHIQGMRRVTLKWKLFPFSLLGKARQWYSRYLGSVDGEWEKLQAKFCLTYFPISHVAHLRREILNFKQEEKESLGAAWARITYLASLGPDLAITEPTLMQYFYLGLRQSSARFLDLASKGAFLHLPISEGRVVLATILDNTPLH